MQRIAFYGKGGIGKSTVAAGVSLALARQGRRVLHIGCDPKHDSTLTLVQDGPATTVIDQIFERPTGSLKAQHLIMPGKEGIDCIESGGPQAGVGCGGRAVSRMFEVFEEIGVLDEKKYDVAVFDVLGDVVCGGFAAPLRSAFAPKVVIVLSEEMAAGYAANNIARGVQYYLDNGVVLAGLVLNLRDNRVGSKPVERIAKAMNTRILAVLPRDPLVGEAEIMQQSVLEHAPESQVAQALSRLSKKLIDTDPADCPAPTPVELEELRALMQKKD
ncbi:AAA family ATPase [Myxococcota bacterium]